MLKDFAIQLYSVRNEVSQAGMPAVLERIAGIGYTGVEFAGYADLSADKMLSHLKQNGLKSVGTHVSMQRLDSAFDEEMAYSKTLGTGFIIVPYASLGSADEVRQTAKQFNEMAVEVKKHGFRFAYHNHGHEFEKTGSKYVLEELMELAPQMSIQLDVFWASSMGCDCVQFIKKHGSRICSLHIKQHNAAGESVDLGDGVLDFKTIIKTAMENGVSCFVHEQEEFSGEAYTCLENGFRHIMSLR